MKLFFLFTDRLTSSVRVKSANPRCYLEYSNALRDAVKLPEDRSEELEALRTFIFAIPKVMLQAVVSEQTSGAQSLLALLIMCIEEL